MKKLFLICVSIGLLGIAGFLGSLWLYWNQPISSHTQKLVLEVSPGDTQKTVLERLRQSGFNIKYTKFRWAARIFGSPALKVGEYEINDRLSPRDLCQLLASGKSIQHAVTIPEGYNIFEIASVIRSSSSIDADEFLKLARDKLLAQRLTKNEKALSLEGYLHPNTYYVTRFTTARDLVELMVEHFERSYAKIQFTNTRLNKHQIVTLASIVEKETGAPPERPRIASVFLNRMKKGMKLQTDPTVIYGLWEQTGKWDGNIRREHLTQPTKYNTYVIHGLPPGPISNPGIESLMAVAQPEQTDFLFFVSRNDGTHLFSKSLNDHNQAVKNFQQNAKARAGKSWRDLKK